jgi:purine-binding chemotaxis protein CheW
MKQSTSMKQSTRVQVDWDVVRNRVTAAYAPATCDEALRIQDRKRVLHERSRELATDTRITAKEEETLSVIEFDLAGERYAVELMRVREVSLLKELTPVPCTPSFVLGIVNLRGEIRTVIDLKRFFELPSKGISELNKIIMLHADGMELGILADSITGVRSVPLSALQPTLPTLTGVRADYLRGVTHDRLVVLDAAKLLSSKRIIVNDEPENQTAFH